MMKATLRFLWVFVYLAVPAVLGAQESAAARKTVLPSLDSQVAARLIALDRRRNPAHAPNLAASLVAQMISPTAPLDVFTPMQHANGAAPILVVGNTDDPATPLAWAQGLAKELGSAVLVTVRSAQHTAYGSGNGCVDRAVNKYLLQRVPPAAGTHC